MADKARNRPNRRARWLEKLSGGRYKRLVFQAKAATAAKAVMQIGDQTGFPHIEFNFVLSQPSEDGREGEIIDDIRIYMTLAEASKFVQQGIHAIDAATPPQPRPAVNNPWGN
jgi:hypothetical protein